MLFLGLCLRLPYFSLHTVSFLSGGTSLLGSPGFPRQTANSLFSSQASQPHTPFRSELLQALKTLPALLPLTSHRKAVPHPLPTKSGPTQPLKLTPLDRCTFKARSQQMDPTQDSPRVLVCSGPFFLSLERYMLGTKPWPLGLVPSLLLFSLSLP